MAKSKKPSVDRRNFLRSAAMAGAATLASPAEKLSAQPATPPPARSVPLTPMVETDPPAASADVLITEHPGSDFMVDVIKSLGFEYMCATPGTCFRSLHESLINYGGNQAPEFITCLHEESSVAMAHGYAKIEGKPLCVCAHGTVGLQHASMAIYNAWCDRVPVYIILGNTMNAMARHMAADWLHSVQDAAAMVRDFVKWDDAPVTLQDFAESAVRAYRITMTPPMEPVVLVADTELQEAPIPPGPRVRIPKLNIATPPQGDSGAVAEAARLLVAAENPVIVLDRAARTQHGMNLLVELAETLQATVVDLAGRMNFPSQHPLLQAIGWNGDSRREAIISKADVLLFLEVLDIWGCTNSNRDQVNGGWRPFTKDGVKLISITASELYGKSNYQDFQRYREVDVDMAADAEATLPSLIEAIKREITAARKTVFQDRGAKIALARQKWREQARTDATYGWDDSPISVARMCAELWAQIKDEDWSLVSACAYQSFWPQRLWTFDKYHQFIGGSGGSGIGYNAPATVGAALANRKHGRLTVSIQGDGDLMFAPGILWTAAHHRIPLLIIMHNNRAYHMEVMFIQRMANQHNRGIDRAGIGTTLQDPNIDYVKIAQGMGMYAEGPIADPKDLGAALRRAIAVVKRGEPALVDVISQAR